MILDEIKKANVEAFKNKDKEARTIYSIVMNKAMLETIKKREWERTKSRIMRG